MNIENEIINNTPQFEQLIPFFRGALESGLAYDFIKGIWNKIPVVNRMVPAKNIAVPCLEGIVLNTDNEILQNSFIAILEKSMDNREIHSQHPSFPKILAQLSSDEIKLLYYISVGKLNMSLGVVSSQIQNHNKIFHEQKRELSKHLTCNSDFHFYEEHLEHLNLISVAKNAYGLALTQYSEKLLKTCLNEKSEELLKEIISEKS